MTGNNNHGLSYKVDLVALWKEGAKEMIARQERLGLETYSSLVALGVAKVKAHYNGCDGQGFVNEITFMNMEGQEIEIKEDALTNGLATTIKTFVCAVLPIGWSIDDGSRGTILLNVAEKKLKFEHEEYVTKDTTWEEEWDIPADEEDKNGENEDQDDATEATNGKKVISLQQARADVLTAFEESLADEDDLTHVVMYYYEAELPSEDALKLSEEYNRVVGPGKLIFINDKPHIELQNKDDE